LEFAMRPFLLPGLLILSVWGLSACGGGGGSPTASGGGGGTVTSSSIVLPSSVQVVTAK
jgi:hypothetical protein